MRGVRPALLAGLAVPVLLVGACVIAEPPTDVPTAPSVRPTIDRASVVPPSSAVLTSWPDRFYVPVRLSDPRETFFVAYFVDFDASGGGNFSVEVSTPVTGNNGSVRTLTVLINQPVGPGCHVVEVFVARQLADQTLNDSRGVHTPADPLNDGDSIVWYFNPDGDSAGCPTVDPNLLLPEGGAEAGAEGGGN